MIMNGIISLGRVSLLLCVLAQTPSTGTLRPCKEESKNWDTTENLYIEGDNLRSS